MNKAKRTARKRRHLLAKGIGILDKGMDPKSLLGRWALRIWMRGRPIKSKALEA